MTTNRLIMLVLFFVLILPLCPLVGMANPYMQITKLNNEIEKATPEQLNQLYTFRARQYIETYQYEEAVEDFSRVIRQKTSGRLYLERGNVYLILKKYEKALADAEEAKKLTPGLYKEADHLATLTLIKQNRQKGTLATVQMQGNPNRDAGAKRNHIYKGRQSSNKTTSIQASAGIRGRCQDKWGTDYRMVEYCINKQSEAQAQVENRASNGIKRSCQEKWGGDYRMVEYCIQKQSDAKSRLGM